MTCICGHPRDWHRGGGFACRGRRCHSWGCRCDRFIPISDDDLEPDTRAFARGGSHMHRGAA